MNPNREEKVIIESLFHQGYKNIEFEPDGNIPPDLLVENRIAIEVRRLNQNQLTDNGFKGLEQDEYSIHGLLRNIMDTVSEKEYDRSAFVGYYFSRPLPSKKEIKKFAFDSLQKHKEIISQQKEYVLNDRFKLTILPSTNKLDQQYRYGMSSDEDTGGFVVNLVYKNLKLIIPEKEKKVKKYKDRYVEWWLAVVDTIGYGFSELDLNQFHSLPKIENEFDKLLLVSATNPKSFYFLY